MKSGRLRTVSSVLLTIMAAAAVWVIYRNGSSWLESINGQVWTLSIPLLALSALLLGVSLAVTPLGWVIICQGMGSGIDRADLFSAWYTSQLGRYIPGKIWLFAGRAGFLKARGMNGARAAATTMYELLFSVASVGLVTMVTVIVSPGLLLNGTARTAGAAAGAAVLLLPLLHPVQKAFCRKRNISPDTLPSPGRAMAVTGLFSLLWTVRGLALYLLLSGTGIAPLDPAGCIAAAPLSWLAGYIVVVVPGGIGVREAAAAALAAPAAVVPAAMVIAGQRIFMGVVELFLAVLGSKRIMTRREDGSR